jgi:BlaI family penicillinase repressor
MQNEQQSVLTKREQQVMEVMYREKKLSAKQVWERIPDFPSYSAVRSVLTILEGKGLLTHSVEGRMYVYTPAIEHRKAVSSAVKQLLRTYFDGSLESAVAAMLEIHGEDMTEDDFKRLSEIIARAGKEEENNAADDT